MKSEIVHGPSLDFIPDAGGLGKVFFTKMLSHGDAIAQIDVLTGEKDTYNSLLNRSIRTAIALKAKGITRNDIITICSFNHLNSCVPFLASLFLGVKPANLDPTIPLSETVFLLNKIKPKLIFVGSEAVQLMEDALATVDFSAKLVVFGQSKIHTEFQTFLQESPEEKTFKPIEIDNLKETAIIFFSSGTTGLSKGICINHFGLLGLANAFLHAGFDCNVFLGFASMYWISTTVIITCCVLHKGCRVVAPKFDPNTAWDVVVNCKVTAMFLAPSQFIALFNTGKPTGKNICLTYFVVAGGPLAKEKIQEVREILPETSVVMGYGLTEITALGTIFEKKDMMLWKKKHGSSGKPVAGLSYKVVDIKTGKALGPNQSGELMIKSPFEMNGYYNEDSSDAWDVDGWLKSGDIAYYDEDHCFFIVDRVKEMLKFQSWHVLPAQLEAVLLSHPDVELAVVIGIPHLEDGDHPMGVVVLKGSRKVDEKEIEMYVEKRVGDRMRLRGGVRIVDCIPMTPTGKIKRREVRDMMLRKDF